MNRKPRKVQSQTAGAADALRARAEEISRDTPGGAMKRLKSLSSSDAERVFHELQVHQIELELQNDELRAAQNELEASRARYFDLYDMAPVGYFTLTDAGLILESNLTGATLLGVSRSALVGQPFNRFVFADDSDTYYLHRKALLRTQAPQAFELRLSGQGAAPITAWIETMIAHGEGGVATCRLVVSDISARQAIEEELRQGQSMSQTAGAMAHIGGWAIHLPDNNLFWSDEICRMLGFPIGTVPTLTEALTLYTPASYEIISDALKLCATQGTAFDCELEIFTKTRQRLNVRAIGKAVTDRHGQIVGMEGAFQDVSTVKEFELARASLEAQLRESQKMEAIGTLAGGIAHDFNNILAVILGNVELARRDAGANWQALVSLEEIQKAGNRARDLVQQILSFSRRQPTSRRIMPLAPAVEDAVRLLRAALPGGPRIECRIASDTPTVLANATQVQQVLLNLGTNAAHAMADRAGNIEIFVDGILVDDASARPDHNLRPGRYARVMIVDAGKGMDAATQRRIFEPFFTTKPAGKGTGLGLSVVHGIMQAHDGAIVVHSEPGKGSRFELYFPRASGSTEALAPRESPHPASEGRGQRILYLDDDEAQLFLIKRMFERWGYRVSAYLEQGEALDALRAGQERIDLVVTDFNMPGMSGLEVARQIHDLRPELPVIVVSGYVTDELRTQAAAVGVRELIAKPQDIEELRDVVQRLVPPPKAVDRNSV